MAIEGPGDRSWTSVSAYWAMPALFPVASAITNGVQLESKTCVARASSTRAPPVLGVGEGAVVGVVGGAAETVGVGEALGGGAVEPAVAGRALCVVRATPVPTEMATNTMTTPTTVPVAVALRRTRTGAPRAPKLMSCSTFGSGVPGANGADRQ